MVAQKPGDFMFDHVFTMSEPMCMIFGTVICTHTVFILVLLVFLYSVLSFCFFFIFDMDLVV